MKSVAAILLLIMVVQASQTAPSFARERSGAVGQNHSLSHNGPTATTIVLNPVSVEVEGCGVSVIDVQINDVADLYGADVRLSFDPSAIEVVDFDPGLAGAQIEKGDLLHSSLFFTARNNADNTAGTIFFVITQLNPALPVSGSGTLARIHVRGKVPGTSSITFTYTKLATRDAEYIPATASSGGEVTVTAPAAPSLSIDRYNVTDVELSWTAAGGVATYSLYRDSAPYFTAVDPAHHSASSASYVDVNTVGDPAVNYYYVVKTTCETGYASPVSNRVGEFDFMLVPGD